MTKWKDIATFGGSVLMFVGITTKLQKMGVLEDYWWAIIAIGFVLFTYVAAKLNGMVPGAA